ncbi:hypothetical protein BOX17_00685 [Halomonas aestuarii]|uniref:Bacterial transcriptional activator domain-containing protein n=1 Tax=Halomonas aestuarii TaxID=1897729 RepID=A0A1J0VC86_9GAMM|nr:BTAD domain-containing putative transcriptional regulator [Halomonas aestuarii]APE29602.1 hypothetical protein BOX17_00685 [Halomonas aestuarii]
MNALTLNVLGDLEVVRDGRVLTLPPSKKTRALLAYLAVNGRPLCREHLCDLLWEMPDDPRGSLRWSLSKLRRVVDEPERPRIIADRLGAALDTDDLDIDLLALQGIQGEGLEQEDIERLERIADRYRGPFLQGLELPNFHDFHGWCLGERERALRAQTALLSALVTRLAEAPERALIHAHALVRLAPFDEDAHARLIRLLMVLNRPREAEQHFRLGQRLLDEAGIPSSGALLRARRATAVHPATGPPPCPATEATPHAAATAPARAPATEAPIPLEGEALEILHWVALLGHCPNVAMLARLSGFEAQRIVSGLELGEQRGLLQAKEHGLCLTDDDLARRLYEAISPTRRQMMHRHVAEQYLGEAHLDPDSAAELAHHARQSGDPALAAEALVAAGRACLRFFANDEALRLARQGIEMAERLAGARRISLLIELRDVMLHAAPLEDWQDTAGELVALAEQALEHGALAHARLGYQLASQVRWSHGQWRDAHEEALQAERVTHSADDRDQVVAMAETAKCLAMLERDLEQAAGMLDDARTLAARQRFSHPAIPMALALMHFHGNRLDEAEDHFKEARTLCKAGGDRLGEFQANEGLLMLELERERFPEALKRGITLAEIGDKLREGSEAPFACAALALCGYALNDEASPLEPALARLRDTDAKHRLCGLLIRAAQLDLKRGRALDAIARAGEALTHARTLERATEQLLAHGVLAEAHRATGDTDARRHHAQAAAEIARRPVARWARLRTAALLADSRPEDTA